MPTACRYLFLLFLFMFVQGSSLRAQESQPEIFDSPPRGTLETGDASDGRRVTVRLDGRSLFRVGASADSNLSADGRARRIEQRLVAVLATTGKNVPTVQMERSGENRLLTASGILLVAITQNDADLAAVSVDNLANEWKESIEAALPNAINRRRNAWTRFATEIQASVQTAFARLLDSTITIVPRGLAALVVIAFFWLLAAGVRHLMRFVFFRTIHDETVENLIRQIAQFFIWLLGGVVAVDALGFNPQTVATGLGLSGIALGFALKDILSNFVSGLLLLMLRPFQIGDQIVIGETEGDVRRITLRATEIRTYDGRVVLVPNGEVFTSRVVNNTAHPIRRGTVLVYLEYAESLIAAVTALRLATEKVAGVLPDPPPSTLIRELAETSVVVEVRFWTDSRRSDFIATESAVRGATLDALREAKIALPDATVPVAIVSIADRTVPRREAARPERDYLAER